MLVVLGDPHADLRDLVGLVAVGHAQIDRASRLGAASAAALGEPVKALVGGLGPGQMRPQSAGLLAPRPP
jgi:hypothetical protein